MADAGGALEAQQTIAAGIPDKNMAANLAGVELFANAFYRSGLIGAKRRQLENALQMSEMKNILAEQKHQDDMRAQSIRFGLAEQGLQLRATLGEAAAQRAADHNQMMADWYNHRMEKDDETNEGVGTLMTATRGLDVNSKEFREKIADLATQPAVQRALQTRLGTQLMKAKYEDYNLARRREVDLSNAKRAGFDKDVKDTFGFVDDKFFLHPEWWMPAEKPTDRSWAWKDAQGNTQHITVPRATINQFKKRYDAMMKERNSIQPQIDNEYTRSVPAGSTTPQMSDTDQQMLNYARTHPGDPRSQKIYQKLGINE